MPPKGLYASARGFNPISANLLPKSSSSSSSFVLGRFPGGTRETPDACFLPSSIRPSFRNHFNPQPTNYKDDDDDEED